jgi:hypothetical protein
LLAAAAAPLTYGVIGIYGPLVPLTGLRWNVLTLLAVSVLSAAIVYGLGRLTRTERWQQSLDWPRSRHWMLAGAVLLATGVGLVAMGRASGFTAIPQWWDASFHANAIRFIADSGDSSPAALKAINATASTNFFYPNAYHVLDATVRQIGGWPIPQVMDVSNGFQAGLFSLSIAVMVARTTRMPALAAASAILACAFTQFPYDTLTWGPLFPFTAGVALIPALLALLGRAMDAPSPGTVVTTAIAGVGLTAVHPSVTVAAVIPAAFFLAQHGSRAGGSRWPTCEPCCSSPWSAASPASCSCWACSARPAAGDRPGKRTGRPGRRSNSSPRAAGRWACRRSGWPACARSA